MIDGICYRASSVSSHIHFQQAETCNATKHVHFKDLIVVEHATRIPGYARIGDMVCGHVNCSTLSKIDPNLTVP